jgi:hypothetical protein
LPPASIVYSTWSTRSLSNTSDSTSGTVTITGSSASFYAQAISTGTSVVDVSITINGITRIANRNGISAGTSNSTTFVLTPGTYAYSVSVGVDSGSGQGGIIGTLQ